VNDPVESVGNTENHTGEETPVVLRTVLTPEVKALFAVLSVVTAGKPDSSKFPEIPPILDRVTLKLACMILPSACQNPDCVV
jgi:hypothetical protein